MQCSSSASARIISCLTSSLTIARDLMLLTAHVRWLQTGPTYDGNVGVARFRDFSPMRKLEIWCEIYFGLSSVVKRAVPPRATLWYRRLPTRSLRGVVRALIASMTIRFGGVELYLRSARLGFAFSAIGPRCSPRNRFRIRFRAYSWVRNLVCWLLSCQTRGGAS